MNTFGLYSEGFTVIIIYVVADCTVVKCLRS